MGSLLHCKATTHSLHRLVAYVTTIFQTEMMTPSDPSGRPTTPTYDTMSRVYGAQKLPDGRYEHVPEQFPMDSEGKYYRRSPPLTLVEGTSKAIDALFKYGIRFGVYLSPADLYQLHTNPANPGGYYGDGSAAVPSTISRW